MAACPKRIEMEARRAKVAALALSHVRQEQIAEALKVNQATVSRDLTWLRKRWEDEALRDISQIIAQEVLELDDMERDVILRWNNEKDPTWIEKRLAIKRQRQNLLGLGPKPIAAIIDQSVNIDASQHLTVQQTLVQYVEELGREAGGQFLDVVAARALGPVLGD